MEKIQAGVLWELYDKVCSLIEQQFFTGCLGKIEEEHPALYRLMEEQEERVHHIKKRCQEGEATLEQYREALKGWYRLVMRGIGICRPAVGRQSCNVVDNTGGEGARNEVDNPHEQGKMW